MSISKTATAVIATFSLVAALIVMSILFYYFIRRHARYQANKLDKQYRSHIIKQQPPTEKKRSYEEPMTAPNIRNSLNQGEWVPVSKSSQATETHRCQSPGINDVRPLSYLSRNGSVLPSRMSFQSSSGSSSSWSPTMLSQTSNVTTPESIASIRQFGGMNPLLTCDAGMNSARMLPSQMGYYSTCPSEVDPPLHLEGRSSRMSFDLTPVTYKHHHPLPPNPGCLVGEAVTTDLKEDNRRWTSNKSVVAGANLIPPPAMYFKSSQRRNQRRHYAVVS